VKRFLCLFACCGIACLQGCGPLLMPMPARLKAEGLKKVDESWERALAPVDRLGHQEMLDIFIATHAYQVGVDSLTLRSEKNWSRGKVVMEIHFNRDLPTDDGFEVKVYDEAGALVRQENYSREEIEQTYRELFVDVPLPRAEGDIGDEPPETAKKRAALKARLDAISRVFPMDQDGKEEPNPGMSGRR
jgi:hypothetical protein